MNLHIGQHKENVARSDFGIEQKLSAPAGFTCVYKIIFSAIVNVNFKISQAGICSGVLDLPDDYMIFVSVGVVGAGTYKELHQRRFFECRQYPGEYIRKKPPPRPIGDKDG